MSKGEQSPLPQGRGQMDGTKPITDRDSMKVVLRAERGDVIQVSEVVQRFRSGQAIPEAFCVRQRTSTYYGAELLIEPDSEGSRKKFLITAPGPDAYLYLWASETDDEGFREGWAVVAELKAKFAEQMPQYPLCQKCGEPIKSLEHERLAALDNCPSASN